MDIKGNTINQVKDEWVCDLAFPVDVTGYLNKLNLKLQKQGQLVLELRGHVKAFCNKLRLLESQIRAKTVIIFIL
jgi:predicted nucleic acid-binding protein